jgi:hypothetical protein
MAGKMNLGSRTFDAKGFGRLTQQSSVTSKQIRWSCMSDVQPLIAVNGEALMAANIAVVPGSKLIIIRNILAVAIFTDSSTGAKYNLSNSCYLYLYQNNFSNLDYSAGAGLPIFPSQAKSDNYEILCNLITDNVAIDLRLSGGDVLIKAGVTPAAGDSVQMQVSILYEPL